MMSNSACSMSSLRLLRQELLLRDPAGSLNSAGWCEVAASDAAIELSRWRSEALHGT